MNRRNDRSRWAATWRFGIIGLALAAGLRDVQARDDGPGAASNPRPPLIEGVRAVVAPGAPGSLAVFATTATAVVAGKSGGGQVAVIAAGHLGRGRVVAFAHDGYFGEEALRDTDTARLVLNAVRWVANKPKPRVGLVDGRGMRAMLSDRDIAVEPATLDRDLRDYNVLVLTPFHTTAAQIAQIREFVRAGGGLLAAATGWGWQQLNGNKPMTEFPGNHLFAGTGIAWTDGMAETGAQGKYIVQREVSSLINAAVALRRVEERGKVQAADVATAVENIRLALRTVPADETDLRGEIRKLMTLPRQTEVVPSRHKPVRTSDAARRLAVGLETALALDLPPREIRAAAAAREFPGAVPAGAPRIERTVTIDTSVPGWHSLGLYASPGVLIRVDVPQSAVGLGLTVQIGSHTDGLWHLDSWERAPEVVRRFSIRQARTVAASAFGGIVYIDVPHRARAGKVAVTIAGAVEAPFYQLGVTRRDEWIAKIRNRPGPWAELAGKSLIVTVPSAAIRSLDDPGPLMTLWDRIVADQDAMVSLTHRERPERIVTDVQISAGYMHSGYPIMAPTDGTLRNLLSEQVLRREGSWGHLHELGHNHQEGDWTFEGTGEVTNNLLVVHVYDALLKLQYDSGHDEIRGSQKRAERIRKHMARGSPFAEWKNDPFLALMMYIQLYEGFGWSPFERVFAEYRKLPAGERPRSDDEKRDQWLVRLSRTVGKNLGPFFQAWGVPTSEKARASIADLPGWMPVGFESGEKP